MYEYKFIKVEFSTFGIKPKEDYQAIVNDYAKEGWRLMQVLTPPTAGYGVISYYELVFERQV